jgi:hypothetical protein
LAALTLTACGSDVDGEMARDLRASSLHIRKAVIPLDHPRAQIVHYRVAVRGPDIEPFTLTVPSDQDEVVFDALPIGSERTIEIEGINARDQVVLSGVTVGHVVADAPTRVVVELQRHPLFANLDDADTVRSTRLRPEILGEPGSQVVIHIDRLDADGATVEASKIVAASLAISSLQGLAPLSSGVLDPGWYRLTATDAQTQRRGSVRVLVVDGARVRPAPLWSAAADVGRIGNPWGEAVIP